MVFIFYFCKSIAFGTLFNGLNNNKCANCYLPPLAFTRRTNDKTAGNRFCLLFYARLKKLSNIINGILPNIVATPTNLHNI
jgi:hypothetical protein